MPKKNDRRPDYVLLVAVVALVVVGVLFVYSASSYSAERTYGNKFYFATKQAIGAAVGIVALVVCSFLPMRLVRKMWIVGVVLSVVLLALVFVPGIGIENYGAKRWIGFGGFSMQPSEIAKFAFVLFAAVYMSRADMSRPVCCLPVLGVGCLLCLLIIAEPNMSITVCMAAVMLAMLFIGGNHSSHIPSTRKNIVYCRSKHGERHKGTP